MALLDGRTFVLRDGGLTMSDDFVGEDLSLIPAGMTVENQKGMKAIVVAHDGDGTWLRLEGRGIPGFGEEVREPPTCKAWRRVMRDIPLSPPTVLAGRKVVAAFEAARFTIVRDGDRVTLAMVDAQAFVEAVAELDKAVGR